MESQCEKEIFKYNILTKSNVAHTKLREMDFILDNFTKMLPIQLALEIQRTRLVLASGQLKRDAKCYHMKLPWVFYPLGLIFYPLDFRFALFFFV
jgi:hypothetical protein